MLLFLARMAHKMLKGYFRPFQLVESRTGEIAYSVPFRCWPIDMDIFMHMNNASYVRVAELARWAIFMQSNTLRTTVGASRLFLAVENNVVYKKPIAPFARYHVKVSISSEDNKWIHYKHTFQSIPVSAEKNQQPEVYAVIDTKAVVKERSGKTVRVQNFVENSDFYKRMIAHNDRVFARTREINDA